MRRIICAALLAATPLSGCSAVMFVGQTYYDHEARISCLESGRTSFQCDDEEQDRKEAQAER